MVPVHDFQPELRRFVEQGLWGGDGSFGPAWFCGWADETGIVAGFAFHNYQPREGTIEVSGYSTRRDWATPAIVRELFAHAFDRMGCRIVCARHSVRNTRVRRIWRSLGAAETILPRMLADDEDEAVAILHRDDWRQSRFMRSPNGKTRTVSAVA